MHNNDITPVEFFGTTVQGVPIASGYAVAFIVANMYFWLGVMKFSNTCTGAIIENLPIPNRQVFISCWERGTGKSYGMEVVADGKLYAYDALPAGVDLYYYAFYMIKK